MKRGTIKTTCKCFVFFVVFWERTALAVNPDVPAQPRWNRLNWTGCVKGVSNVCTHITAIAISQYLSVTAVLSQCRCFYNSSCLERKILSFPFPTVLCCIFRVRVRIQNSTKFNLGSLVQLCQVTALFSSSWHFGILVLFPIPCWDLLLYTHTCPFSFRTLMSDRSLHVERLQDGDIPPWVSFTINIVPPWVGKWGWDSVVCDRLIFFFFWPLSALWSSCSW